MENDSIRAGGHDHLKMSMIQKPDAIDMSVESRCNIERTAKLSANIFHLQFKTIIVKSMA